jgi:signal transduction histidine kinase
MDFGQAVDVLVQPPGNYVYHLSLILILVLLFATAQIYRTRKVPLGSSWTYVGGTLATLRITLLIVVGVSWLTLVEVKPFLPPLDRLISTLQLIAFASPLVFPVRKQSNVVLTSGLVFFIFLSFIATLVYTLLFGTLGPFNSTWPSFLWIVLGLIIAIGIDLLIIIRKPTGWQTPLIGYMILTAGLGAHLWAGSPNGDYPAYFRLAELIAYPSITVFAIRSLAMYQPPKSGLRLVKLERINGAPVNNEEVIRELSPLISVATLEELAKGIVRTLAHIMRSEYALLLTPPDSSGEFSIAHGYDLIRDKPIPGARLDSRKLPVVHNALLNKRSLNLPAKSHAPDLKSLKDSLSLPTQGPALMAPLLHAEKLLGGVLLLSPYTRQKWMVEDQKNLEHLASHIAQRVLHLQKQRKAGTPLAQGQELDIQKAKQEVTRLLEENIQLRTELASQNDRPSRVQPEDISELVRMQEIAQETIGRLEKEVKRLIRAEIPQTPAAKIPAANRLPSELQEALLSYAGFEVPEDGSDAAALLPFSKPEEDGAEVIHELAQELRRPMSSIVGYTDLLLSGLTGDLGIRQKKFIDRIQTSISKLGTLLNDLVQMTAIDSNGMNLKLAPINLRNCVREAVSISKTLAEEKHLMLRDRIAGNLPLVNADPEALQQVLFHMIQNAFSASPMGGQIMLDARKIPAEREAFVVFSVTDNGGGVLPEFLGKVFDHSASDRQAIQGLGEDRIGLALVKSMVEAMNGRVWIESQVGIGNRLSVLLPAAENNSLKN